MATLLRSLRGHDPQSVGPQAKAKKTLQGPPAQALGQLHAPEVPEGSDTAANWLPQAGHSKFAVKFRALHRPCAALVAKADAAVDAEPVRAVHLGRGAATGARREKPPGQASPP